MTKMSKLAEYNKWNCLHVYTAYTKYMLIVYKLVFEINFAEFTNDSQNET